MGDEGEINTGKFILLSNRYAQQDLTINVPCFLEKNCHITCICIPVRSNLKKIPEIEGREKYAYNQKEIEARKR